MCWASSIFMLFSPLVLCDCYLYEALVITKHFFCSFLPELCKL
uniref:Ring finger protein 146 n=1 Tax=Macaca nemestrina TaxID=9545 RepID=A0A2K6BWN4_MACNE